MEDEIIRILTVWKYIKHLIFLLDNEFILSCRLLKRLAKGIFNHHSKNLPLWLYGLMTNWFNQYQGTFCTDI
jgi:hypothetical protein